MRQPQPATDIPPFRYTAALADEIEHRWQDFWERAAAPSTPRTRPGRWPTPTTRGPARRSCTCWTCSRTRPGAGLHVGHPLGYIGTDCYARYQRMAGRNVLHAMGFDAFGLPAEQYAVQTGTHPRTTTEANIERYRAQLRRLGLAHDDRRSVATIDVDFYRWTQWIFLQIFNSWYDPDARKARPIAELIAEFEAGTRPTPDGRPWAELTAVERRRDRRRPPAGVRLARRR